MVKAELIEKIAEETQLTKKNVGEVIDGMEKVIRQTLLDGEEALIPNIGKIKPKFIPEKTGVIQMGEKKGQIWVKPKHTEPSFKMLDSFRKLYESEKV